MFNIHVHVQQEPPAFQRPDTIDIDIVTCAKLQVLAAHVTAQCKELEAGVTVGSSCKPAFCRFVSGARHG